MWRVLREMYECTKSCVRLDDDLTDYFDIENGVRQGCILSPILFSIFINQVKEELQKDGEMGVEINGVKYPLFLFADDLNMVTNKREEMEEMMKKFEIFCKTWRLTLNTDKSKMIIFQTKCYGIKST